MDILHDIFERSKRGSPSLTAVGFLMAGMLAVFLTGVLVDQRVVMGAPAWLKPAKFAASTSLYAFTTAWILSYLQPWTRVRRIVGGTIGGVFIIEVALIAVQAGRATTSHFNIATPFDAVVFGVMGAAILAATAATVALAVAAFRHRFEDEALGWAIRAGLVVSLAGSMVGGMMTRPTRTQVDAARAGGRLTVAGGHTVGGPDGGPGAPGTGWSLEHGDLRVPHFVGLHALQALPVLALVSRRRLTTRTRTQVVAVGTAAYGMLFLLLLGQALGGQSFVAPNRVVLMALVAWALTTTMVTVLVIRSGRLAGDVDPGSTMHAEVRR